MMTIGIDEVGRGCWAGPLVAGAVLLPYPLEGIKDSKRLTRKQRQDWAEKIYNATNNWGLGWVSPQELDQIGLTDAVSLAMQRALARIQCDYDEIIIDGSYNFLSDVPKTRTLIQADAFISAVSAASILAKVARDAYMIEASRRFPTYGFAQHVGYGTSQHLRMLHIYGATPLHRRSFKPLKPFV